MSCWINLHHVVRKCKEIKGSIRKHRYVWTGLKRIRVSYSLEALEWEFGIERPISIRSHGNHYCDLNGNRGQMQVLSTAKRSIAGTATEDEERALREYCEADVKSMYEIAYAAEKLVFSPSQRRERRAG